MSDLESALALTLCQPHLGHTGHLIKWPMRLCCFKNAHIVQSQVPFCRTYLTHCCLSLASNSSLTPHIFHATASHWSDTNSYVEAPSSPHLQQFILTTAMGVTPMHSVIVMRLSDKLLRARVWKSFMMMWLVFIKYYRQHWLTVIALHIVCKTMQTILILMLSYCFDLGLATYETNCIFFM